MKVQVTAIVTMTLVIDVNDAESIEEAQERVRGTQVNIEGWDDFEHSHTHEIEIQDSTTGDEPTMIIHLSTQRDETFWSIDTLHGPKLAMLPLTEMDAYVRKNGEPHKIFDTDEVDHVISPVEYIDAIEEQELRESFAISNS